MAKGNRASLIGEALRDLFLEKGELNPQGADNELRQRGIRGSYLAVCKYFYALRDWVSNEAAGLEKAHIKDKKSLVSDFLSQRLKRGAWE